ncbi:MAG: hypothetical protein QF570_14165 [Myxococcota bacterium]|nr:hypothetical protein [Myxococcota bacterium]
MLFAVLVVGAGVAYARPAVPHGVHYDLPLEKGEWSLSYAYRREEGRGLRDGTDRVDTSDASSASITQVPTRLDSDVHTFGVRYAPFKRLTLSLMLPLIEREMRTRSFDGGGDRYTTRSSGLGDLEIAIMFPFMTKGEEALDLFAGLRLPTGEISERDDIPGDGDSGKVLLPRSMQTGSRSVALLAGLTYSGSWEGLGWGVHGNGSIGVEDNPRHYRHGDVLSFSGWLAHDIVEQLSASLRIGYDRWKRHRGDKVVGPDDHLASLRSRTRGQRLSLSPGLNIALPFKGEQRLSLEASWPVYQKLVGPQVERDWTLSTGWKWVF